MSINSTDRAASREVRAYDRAMLRAQFASLFWAAILEKRKSDTFTLSALAEALGKNKAEVSRWFSGDAPNWTLGTVAEIAHALDLQIHVEARDRSTGMVLTAAGPKESQPTDGVEATKPGAANVRVVAPSR
jgi:transcriptional regulator with XRE-family HTH domain